MFTHAIFQEFRDFCHLLAQNSLEGLFGTILGKYQGVVNCCNEREILFFYLGDRNTFLFCERASVQQIGGLLIEVENAYYVHIHHYPYP